jgi:hypothetical protein
MILSGSLKEADMAAAAGCSEHTIRAAMSAMFVQRVSPALRPIEFLIGTASPWLGARRTKIPSHNHLVSINPTQSLRYLSSSIDLWCFRKSLLASFPATC